MKCERKVTSYCGAMKKRRDGAIITKTPSHLDLSTQKYSEYSLHGWPAEPAIESIDAFATVRRSPTASVIVYWLAFPAAGCSCQQPRAGCIAALGQQHSWCITHLVAVQRDEPVWRAFSRRASFATGIARVTAASSKSHAGFGGSIHGRRHQQPFNG